MQRPSPPLALSDDQRSALERVARSQREPARRVIQARALLGAAEGASSYAIGAELGVSPSSVGRWRESFARSGVEGLWPDPLRWVHLL